MLGYKTLGATVGLALAVLPVRACTKCAGFVADTAIDAGRRGAKHVDPPATKPRFRTPEEMAKAVSPSPDSFETTAKGTADGLNPGIGGAKIPYEIRASEVDRWIPHEGERLATKTYKAKTDYFAKLATQPRLVSLIPTDEAGFKEVFRGRSFSAARGRQLTRFRRDVKRAGGEIRDSEHFDFHAFEALLEAHDPDHPLVLIGHSEREGDQIVLPNGDPVPMMDIQAACAERQVNCLVLTCHSETFAEGEPITADQALAMWRAGQARAGEKEPLTMEEFANVMRRARLKMKLRRRLAIGGLVTSSAAGPRYAVGFFAGDDDE